MLAGHIFMNKTEWITSSEPDELLIHIQQYSCARKMRLFCCACVRRIWYRLKDFDAARRAVEIAEAFADGNVSESELVAAQMQAETQMVREVDYEEWNALAAATWCASKQVDALGIARSIAWGSAYGSSEADEIERSVQLQLLRDIFGNQFRSARENQQLLECRTLDMVELARQMYESRDFSAMRTLASMLDHVGCPDADSILHCSTTDLHVRGCWLIDLLLEKSDD